MCRTWSSADPRPRSTHKLSVGRWPHTNIAKIEFYGLMAQSFVDLMKIMDYSVSKHKLSCMCRTWSSADPRPRSTHKLSMGRWPLQISTSLQLYKLHDTSRKSSPRRVAMRIFIWYSDFSIRTCWHIYKVTFLLKFLMRSTTSFSGWTIVTVLLQVIR